MILIAIQENDEDLEKVKQWASIGMKVYTNLNGQVVRMKNSSEAEKTTKSEVMNLLKPFRYEEEETQQSSEDTTKSEQTESQYSFSDGNTETQREEEAKPTEISCERYNELDGRIKAIENVLKKPLLD